jgi:serine/arginine repetitive matrix protein 2
MRESDAGPFENSNANVKSERRTSRESKHSVEGRRRTSLASVFPQARRLSASTSASTEEEAAEEVVVRYPIVTIEEATVDGHGCLDDDEEDERMMVGSDSENGLEEEEDRMNVDESEKGLDIPAVPAVAATPVKKARTRPMSEQLLGRGRPKPMYEDDEGTLLIFLFFFPTPNGFI